MTKLNYERLVEQSPTKYSEIINDKGQRIEFYEHPTRGGDYPVIAVCHELKLAFATDFWDLHDMTCEYTDYRPYFVNNELVYGFELENIDEIK